MEAITDDDYDDHEYDHENADELKVKDTRPVWLWCFHPL